MKNNKNDVAFETQFDRASRAIKLFDLKVKG